jgi:hypothetical protein
VLAAAGIAAYVSYWHAYAVVRAHGESGITARLEPATIDGLMYASSMVVLYAAPHRVPRCGRSATTAATAAGFSGQGERDTPDQARRPAAQVAGPPAIPASGRGDQAVPDGGAVDDAVVAAYQRSAQAGNPLSERKLAQMFGRTSRRWARARIAEARSVPSSGLMPDRLLPLPDPGPRRQAHRCLRRDFRQRGREDGQDPAAGAAREISGCILHLFGAVGG